MLARVKWRGDRYDAKGNRVWERGTLLALTSHNGHMKCAIAWDGNGTDPDTRGQIVSEEPANVRVVMSNDGGRT